jgi:hypothetical protein
MSRTRVVAPGPVRLEGRAWSGGAPVARVEVSPDGGGSWRTADLAPAGDHPWAWRRFGADWDARPGVHTLAVRATDAGGRTQPIEADAAWNRGGFATNPVQRITVHCLD